MAFLTLIFTARRLEKLKQALLEEKLEAIKISEDESYKPKFKFRHLGTNIKVAFHNCFGKCFKCSEKARGYKTCYKLGHEGSCENYFLKSLLGFFGGVFLTYFLYIFFVFQLNVKLTSATVVCSFLGCLLTVGLAFSSRIRCIVLLTLPQFFSKRGRQALMAYAFALALTGPAKNTLNNLGILNESLACGQEQLKQAVKQIIDVIKKPFMAIKEAIKKVVKTVKEVVKKIKEILLKIKRVVMALVRVIKSVFEFLGKIINICNKELGTPFERCTRVFENAIADCNAKLGPLFNWLCSLTYIVKAVCYIVKIFDYVCMLVDFISESVVGVIIRKVKTFVRHIKTMFYVRIKFSHSFEFQTKASKSMTEIAKEIVAEIKHRSRHVVAFFNFMTSACMLFFLFLIFQVVYYRLKYLTSERFDNIYITENFRFIDLRRAKLGKQTVLPLTKNEKQLYVPISSFGLARVERKQLSKAITTLVTASVKLATHMIADYCLYWIMTLISRHARYQSKVQAPNLPVAHIQGDGFIATLLRSIVNAFQPVGIKLEIDTVPCLPIPIPPDFDRYIQIAITILLCWILTVLEPYGLRFRNYIMRYYYPVRAKQRTIWLYNHILRYRTSFLILTRRKLRKKFGMQGGPDEMSCKDLLRSKLNCSIFRICFGDAQKTCLLCGEVFREKDKNKFIKCRTPNCPGLFCLECFADLNNICPICLKPIEYGDLDDFDEEQDSSGDEPPPPKKKRKCPWLPCGKPKDDDKEPLIEREDGDKTEPEDQEKSDSEYSYSYQDDKDQEPYPTPIAWRDVEKQKIADEASMESFRDDEEDLWVDIDNKVKVPRGRRAMVRMDVEAEVDKELSDGDDDIKSLKDAEEVPLIDSCKCSTSSTPRHVEFIGLPNEINEIHKEVRRIMKNLPPDCPCVCSDLDLATEYIPKSTMFTSTRSDCKYCRCSDIEIRPTLKVASKTEEELQNIVPKLDLSFLEKTEQKCSCDNSILSNRFNYVTYYELSEISSRSLSRRSLDSSSALSNLQNSPEVDIYTPSVLRRRNVTNNQINDSSNRRIPQINISTQYSNQEADSPSSMSSYEFNRAQNRRVKQYYDATKKMCTDRGCQCSNKKPKTFLNILKKFIPKRRKKQKSYLPLTHRDIDDEIEVKSYNYHQENWDSLSTDTSPTYPFGGRSSPDTSDEEQELLSGRRIRGGECKHLINCKFIGRECPQKKIRSCEALGLRRLNDFPSHSLPPKSKPKIKVDSSFQYFTNIEELLSGIASENSMKRSEASEDENFNINPNIKKLENNKTKRVTDLLASGASSPPSADSVLSENTCSAIFGTLPAGLSLNPEQPSLGQNSALFGEKLETAKADTENEASLKSASIESRISKISNQSIKRNSVAEKTASKESQRVQLLEKEASDITIKKSSSFDQPASSLQENQTEIIQPAAAKRKSTQLNQLLYKDDRTEISLVQKLSPKKENTQSRTSFTELPPTSISSHSPIKLKISLHNTIIPEEGEREPLEMTSPKSKDKIIETRDSFPLHQDWPESTKTGKIILSSDKTQQTSDNNFYRPLGDKKIHSSKEDQYSTSTPSVPTRPNISDYSRASSDPRYDLPEKDVICRRNNCSCAICRTKPVAQASHCNCCRCANAIDSQTTQEPIYQEQMMAYPKPDYHVTAYPPSSTNTELADYSPPPPPLPQRHTRMPRRIMSPVRYRNRCHEKCTCGLKQPQFFSHSGDYDQPSGPFRYQPETNRYDMGFDNRDGYEYSDELRDLPYQNNEEYLQLVEELQDTLHSRNRNRVKRAMQEFEARSKENKPLEKPIINYDETSDSEEPIIRKIDQLRGGKTMCCAREKCTCGKMKEPRSPKARRHQRRRERLNVDERPSHWTMDPGSGEWQKANRNRSSKDEDFEHHCTCNCVNCEQRY